ncbi:MAG: hypothetical protein QOJ02_615 [Acidobacteriota bacterium]|jgi:hypothetical protein|nr:hypothetical protein [Acidobacteriota bacterium]
MPNISRKHPTTLALWSIVWALAIITSAILFKGNPIKDWVQAALFIGAITLWLWLAQRTGSCSR